MSNAAAVDRAHVLVAEVIQSSTGPYSDFHGNKIRSSELAASVVLKLITEGLLSDEYQPAAEGEPNIVFVDGANIYHRPVRRGQYGYWAPACDAAKFVATPPTEAHRHGAQPCGLCYAPSGSMNPDATVTPAE